MTITHEVEREEVMAYLDGALEPARARDVLAHLDRCVDCRAFADQLREMSLNLQEWTVDAAPATLVAPAGAVRDRSSRGGFGAWLRGTPALGLPRWAFAAGAGLAAAAVLVVAGQTLQRSRPKPEETALTASIEAKAAADRVRSLGYASSSAAMNGPTIETMLTRVARASAAKAGSADVQAGGAAATLMVVRTATISLSSEKFDDIRPGLERVVAAHHGTVAALTVAGDPPNQRSINATLRVPVAELDAALAGVRALGRVLQESQSSEDVTDAHRDLAIRISNAKVEEARLEQILKDRTGKLSDVLAVEQEQARVRTEIEQMEAEELAMRGRAAYSTITVDVSERYIAALADTGPTPLGIRLRNALVDGARAAIDSIVGVALAALNVAPLVILWGGLLFLPVRMVVRRLRERRQVQRTR
jgi:predicted anti-sigma-YlaC factor YlaD